MSTRVARQSLATSNRERAPLDTDRPCKPSSRHDLDALYREEAPRLTRFFKRRVTEAEETPDLVQESFARLLSSMAQERLANPAPYLQRIARNLLFERGRRRRARHADRHMPIEEAPLLPVVPDQAHAIEADDLMRVYRRALDELPERTRQVFLLHRLDELPYREIAARLGISIPTVQYHVARALAHIDAALEKQ